MKGRVDFNQLYRFSYQQLFAVAMRYSVGEDVAKDILQETYIKIFKYYKSANFETQHHLFAWMKKICINEALVYIRKKNNWDKLQKANKPEMYMPTYEFDNSELFYILIKLPLQQRLCFSLFAIDGYSHKEIADKLDIKESHSRVLVTRARKQLSILISKKRTYEIL